jgi:diaminohydroxyphosphoribosylaminopyrimidine deaminase/5-amino-6-(5-phosphoribosylamino)uracil reductase
VRVVLAGRRVDLPARARLLASGGPPTWVVVPQGAAPGRVRALERRGVDVLPLPAGGDGRVPFDRVLRALAARGVTTLLVEGGGAVAAAALRARVVDRVVLFLAPAFLGGDGVAAIASLGLRRAARALRLVDVAVGRTGDDLVVEGRVRGTRA